MKPYRAIRGRELDGSYASEHYVRIDAAMSRRERADRGLCINGRAHGKATRGCRCERCYLVHKHGLVVARQMPEWKQ